MMSSQLMSSPNVDFHVLRYMRVELPCGLPASDSYNSAAAVQLPLSDVYHLAAG
jgi:hypothetical protein